MAIPIGGSCQRGMLAGAAVMATYVHVAAGTTSAATLAGKLDLYVGAAGFHPGRVLPCVIDVGTDNLKLQNNELYLGGHPGCTAVYARDESLRLQPSHGLACITKGSAARAGLHQPRIKDQQLYFDMLDEVNSRGQGIHAQRGSLFRKHRTSMHVSQPAQHIMVASIKHVLRQPVVTCSLCAR